MKAWLHAARLRTLPLAAAAIFLGGSAAALEGVFSWPVALLSLLTALLLQVLSNLANDYGDAQQGTDDESRVGPQRAIQAGLLSPAAMLRGIKVCVLLSLTSGLSLLAFSLGDSLVHWLVFLALGLAAIVAAMAYTMGKRPYGYHGWGDISVFCFFGLLGVVGSNYLHALTWQPQVLWAAFAHGLLSAAVLNLNNLRDREPDLQAGKHTLAVRLGAKAARRYHLVLVLGGLACYAAFINSFSFAWSWAWLAVLPASLLLFKTRQGLSSQQADVLDGLLQTTAKLSFVTALFVSLGLLL